MKTRTTSSIVTFLFVIVLALCSFKALGQNLQPVDTFHQNVGVYFLNQNYGFVFTTRTVPYSSNGSGYTACDTIVLYRTTDGCATWKQIVLPPPLRNHWGAIESICFSSSRHGYLSALPVTMVPVDSAVTPLYDNNSLPDTAAGIFMTDDSGISWNRISSSAETGELYTVHSMLFCATGFTTDDGKSWTAVPLSSDFVTGNHDSLVLIGKYESVDFGKTWLPGPGVCYIPPHTETIVPIPYDNEVNTIAGDGCLYYQQNQFQDNGIPHRRRYAPTLSVTGHGNYVFAVDNANILYKSTYYYDAPKEPPHSLLIWHEVIGGPSNDEVITKLCDSASFWTWFQFKADTCTYGGLTGITIDGLDSNIATYSISGVWHPWDEYSDTPKITIVPKRAGSFPILVHLHYSDDDFNEGDTSFPITVVIQPNPGELTVNAPSLINFGTQPISSAKTITKTFSLTASGCEAVVVDSIQFVPDSAEFIDFNFTNVSGFIPNTVPSAFMFSFKPTIADTERGKILVDWSDGEAKHVDTILALGVGVSGLAMVEGSSQTQSASIERIVPNPASSTITIVCEGENPSIHACTISDPLGRRYTAMQKGNVLDISSLPPGVYFVSDGISGAKFIKE